MTTGITSECVQQAERVRGALLEHIELENRDLPYHNRAHADDVRKAAYTIGSYIHLFDGGTFTLVDVETATIAAAGHDLFRGKSAEEKSATLTAILMNLDENSYLNGEPANKAREAILATKARVVLAGSRQETILQDVGPKSSIVSKVLCDADLASLGKPFNLYLASATNLIKEQIQEKDTVIPVERQIIDFFMSNVAILRNHTFHTNAAQHLFPNAKQNSEEIHSTIKTSPDHLITLCTT